MLFCVVLLRMLLFCSLFASVVVVVFCVCWFVLTRVCVVAVF